MGGRAAEVCPHMLRPVKRVWPQCNLKQFVLNSHHLVPRRMWMGSSELRGLTPLPEAAPSEPRDLNI